MTLYQIVWSTLDEDRYLMEIDATEEQVESFIDAFQKDDGYIGDADEFEAYLISHGTKAERVFVNEICVE